MIFAKKILLLVNLKIVEDDFCKKDIIVGQFKNQEEYKSFAETSLVDILKRKETEKEVENMLLE